ncbi:MAG: SDR family oxidoreductase [Phycisphaerales bacterium]|nr:SDR family oxidoreductase [Phycisphaerales bacterium]
MSDSTCPLSLVGRHALVGGATQGIGRACAESFARAGASVTIMGRNGDGLAQVMAGLAKTATQTHHTLLVDYTNWRTVQSAVLAHVASVGIVHIVLHNTGGPPAGLAIDAAPEDFTKAFELHVLTGQAIVQACAPGMRDAKYGRIINITSTSVITPIRGLGISNTIRAAVANWGRTLAGELAPFGITVNTILPGFTRTARLAAIFKGRASRAASTVEEVERAAIATIPAGRLGEADEIASVALFLASPAASYVNGVNLPVDGGRTAMQS